MTDTILFWLCAVFLTLPSSVILLLGAGAVAFIFAAGFFVARVTQ